MAWIEIHQTIWAHRKTLDLALKLGLNETYAAAHMIRLWTWALDNAPEGDLTKVSHYAIARGAGWDGDPEQFVNAAIEAGYLDHTDQGLFIHDWKDYAGRLIERREAARGHMREMRRAHEAGILRMVKQRDGDRCRYCGRIVDWADRKTEKGATYDHVDPSKPASLENLVVSCRGCNSRKAGRTPSEAGMRLLSIGGLNTDQIRIKSGLNTDQIRSGLDQVGGLNPDLPTVPIPNLIDDVCTLDSNSQGTPQGISTEGPGSPDPLYVKVEQVYVELTSRFVSPNDITAISQTIKEANGDVDFIIAIMRKAAANFKPQWQGHRISSFSYFRQAILGELAKRKAWEETRRDGTSSRDSPESARNQIRDATPEEIERYIEQCRQLAGGQLPE